MTLKTKTGITQALVIIAIVVSSIKLVEFFVTPEPLFPIIGVQDIVNEVNSKRAEEGLIPLKISPLLVKSADSSAGLIRKSGIFEHPSKTGDGVADIIFNAGYPMVSLGKPVYVGENIACGYDDAVALVNDWLGSESHRFNILYNKYGETGVSISKFVGEGGLECKLVVMHYGTASTSTLK